MNKVLLILVVCFSASFGYAQSGYFGKKQGISLKIDMSPSIGRVSVLRKDNTLVKQRLRLAYMAYQLNYTLLLGRNIEMSAGYGFNSVRTVGSTYNILEQVSFYDPHIVEDPRIRFHRINLDFNFFYSGNIAPLGNFMGISISQTFANVGPDALFYEAYLIQEPEENSSFFTKKYNFGSSIDDANALSQQQLFRQFDLHLKIGNSYPINKVTTLSYCFRVPLVSTYFDLGIFESGENLLKELGYGWTNDGYHEPEWNIETTLRKYNRYGLELKLTRYL